MVYKSYQITGFLAVDSSSFVFLAVDFSSFAFLGWTGFASTRFGISSSPIKNKVELY